MKIAVVTGAGSGIGRAVARAFLSGGYGVVLAGRRGEALRETLRLSQASEAASLAVPTDVTQPAEVRHLFDAAVARFGRVDVLFNNAGIGAPAVPLDELPVDAWRSVIDVNLTGVFLCMQAAFAVMKAQSPRGGRIINNGSISAHVPRPLSAPYVATKHAVAGLTKSGALDGRPFDIAVGQIDIGNAITEMSHSVVNEGALQADGSRRVEPGFDVEHVARAVLHMASLPLDANILNMTIMATKMPFVGRG